jgi:predicted DNA-binding transcriptional regulator AlpA
MTTATEAVSPLIGTGDIAALLGLSREHVTDCLTKRAGFPRPVVNVSQKLRRWDRAQVMAFLSKKPRRAKPAPL